MFIINLAQGGFVIVFADIDHTPSGKLICFLSFLI